MLYYNVIIIDEISMVSPYLLDFINQMFCELHNSALPFGGIMVLIIRDLAQLPPIRPNYVFKSPAWKVFFPLFLTKSQRQSNDIEFFNLLQEIRIGQLKIYQKFL